MPVLHVDYIVFGVAQRSHDGTYGTLYSWMPGTGYDFINLYASSFQCARKS
ncbi:hypothetical protein GCD22_01986 [Acidithiobacillus thiooxidans ATCC 19377]|uniref:Uncharacterized protein n=1 Tax=Acidithiobacillus thiooxidans ATCC 19377 TaxID=637390 RepID=A0A5P9XSS9_ACITH|nr:hypothetical protein GCD22_01986 [Acidithiobacillus thiooxidans ATCC 19377]